MYARTFKDLVVYQKSKAVSREIFQLTKSFPKEEMYSLTDQIRRASRSIGSQIAEGWAKRRYEKHFISKLTDADGEQSETQHWISDALDCGYITKATSDRLTDDLDHIGRMLNQMILKADVFCQEDARTVRESSAVYGSADPFFSLAPSATGHGSQVTGH